MGQGSCHLLDWVCFVNRNEVSSCDAVLISQQSTQVTIQRITYMKNKSRCSINCYVQYENFVRRFKQETWKGRHFKLRDLFAMRELCGLQEQREKLERFAVTDKIRSFEIIIVTFFCPYPTLFALLPSRIALTVALVARTGGCCQSSAKLKVTSPFTEHKNTSNY